MSAATLEIRPELKMQLDHMAAETLPQNPQIGRLGRIAGIRELTVGRFPFMLIASNRKRFMFWR